ncbi:MAG: 50S ribosomal protein L28 [Planctomycetes bacterium]|nr:50S ribosomal protein L28 [Planctomycetota bacterium]
MANECAVCGKKTTFGIKYARRGAAKAKGGSGAKISGKTGRAFKPNIQNVRADVNGTIKKIKVCTSCLSAGKVKKAARGQLKLRKSLES